MGRIFDLDSPIMRFLSKIADLIYLNILALICCIPIITIGASITSLHYVLLKMVRDEDSYLTKTFFKSFKENFKQSTIIWLIIVAVLALFIGDFYILSYTVIKYSSILRAILIGVGVILLMVITYVFPILSKFDNTIVNTIKNAFFMSILSLPKTIGMMVCYAAPVLLLYLFPQVAPVVIFLGISGPSYLAALMYNKVFKRFEPEEETKNADDWFIEPMKEDQGEIEDQENQAD